MKKNNKNSKKITNKNNTNICDKQSNSKISNKNNINNFDSQNNNFCDEYNSNCD